MQVRCPHCHNPVELVDDSSLRDIECSSCGSSFSLVNDETVSFKREETQLLGHFKLIERVGVGAFGTVWKAWDTKLDRTVAIKIPRKEQLSEQDTEHFFREARAAAQLKHPSIVGVHEVGCDADTIFIVSDYVQGLTVADWLTGQQPPILESVELIAKVADALHTAHEKGIVHRDLKPSNIMLDEDNKPHVMDFGLAKREAGEITMTVDGQVLGTPAYMAPEQARGDAHHADRRADIYSLGVILFELLTGEKPFRGNTRMLLHQVLNEDAPSPRKLNSNVSRDLETITLRCLEKEPSRRFQTATEFSDDLGRFLKDEPVVSRPIGKTERGLRWCRRNPTIATLTGAIAVLLVGGITVVSGLWIRAETNAQRANQFAANYRAEAAKATSLAEREKEARKEAEAEKNRADANFKRAQKVVQEFFTEVSTSRELLAGSPGTQKLRRALLEKAKDYYLQFIEQNRSAPLNEGLADAREQLGNVLLELQELSAAEREFSKALEILLLLVDQNPDVPRYRAAANGIRLSLGRVYGVTARYDKAERHLKTAVDSLQELVAQFPDDTGFKLTLATARQNLGNLCSITGHPQDGISQYNAIIGLGESNGWMDKPDSLYPSTLASAYFNLATTCRDIGQVHEAIRNYNSAAAINRKILDNETSSLEALNSLAGALSNVGAIHLRQDELAKAAPCLEEALSIRRDLAKKNPSRLDYQMYLAATMASVAILRLQDDRFEDARRGFEERLRIMERVFSASPDATEVRLQLYSAYHDLGQFLVGRKEHLTALKFFRDARTTLDSVLAESPGYDRALEYDRLLTNAEAQSSKEVAWALATSQQRDSRDGEQAIALATKACELSEWNNWSYIDTLAAAYAKTGNFDEAVKQQKRAIGMAPGWAKAELEARLKLYLARMPYRAPAKQ